MKSALVTGGCGFLGSAVVAELVRRAVSVRVLALPGERTDNLRGVEVEVARGDVTNPDDCVRAVHGMDTVFHAAAIYQAWVPDPTRMYDVNLSGTFNMLEAARRAGVERVVYTASIVALGRPPLGEVGDETTPYEGWDVDFPYSRSKYASRLIAGDFARWGLDVRIVCPGVVFGPGDIAPTPSGKMILTAMKGGPAVHFEGGASYVDVRDAAAVHVLVADRGRAGDTVIATAHNLDNLTFFRAVDRALGKRRRHVRVPVSVIRAGVRAMDAVARRTGKEPLIALPFFDYSLKPLYFSNAKSVRELGATYRPIDDTLRDAVRWFRERGMAT